MKIPCGIIKDLLPLYIEGLESAESGRYIDEHLAECKACAGELKSFKDTGIVAYETNIEPLKKIKATVTRKRVYVSLLAAILSLTFALLVVLHLSALAPIPYSENLITFTETNGIVSFETDAPATAWYADSYYSTELQGRVCILSLYTDKLGVLLNRTLSNTPIAINMEDNETVPLAGVFYNPNNMTENILVYGESASSDYGAVAMPRLVLNYYLIIAVILLACLLAAVLVSRKKVEIRSLFLHLAYLPAAYITAHFLIKGLEGASFTMPRDLYAILAMVIPLYGLCWAIEKLVLRKKT